MGYRRKTLAPMARGALNWNSPFIAGARGARGGPISNVGGPL